MSRTFLLLALLSAAACGTTVAARDLTDAATPTSAEPGDAGAPIDDARSERRETGVATDSSAACLKLGAVCQGDAPCCEGSCTGTTTCRLGAGDPCNADEDWCGAALECDRKTSTCTFVSCFDNNKDSALCNMFPNIGCCEEGRVCASLGKLAGYGCCIPSGGAVTLGETSSCCSTTVKTVDGGLVCY